MIVSEEHDKKHYIHVCGKRMAYAEEGSGDPIVFLHGNPTSSYLWRNVIPHVSTLGRCIAPDLIGMGDSDKLDESGPDRYRFVEHRRYLQAFFKSKSITQDVTLVVHDWGGALGFEWAKQNVNAVKGIVYMETIVCPLTWDDWNEKATPVFQGFRSPAGESMALEKNIFVEKVLPGSVLRKLGADEMDVYRRPFQEAGEGRRPTLTWPRELPIEGEPADVVEIVDAYGEWLSASNIPKLFINADPGAILVGRQREFCRGWPNQTEVTVKGSHFIQEDSPDEIGTVIADWYQTLG